jgi:uncharacterized protein
MSLIVAIGYHRGCRDGFAAAAVANNYYKQYSKDIRYFSIDPSCLIDNLQSIMVLPDDTLVRIFDVGFTKEGYDLLKTKFDNLYIIDHHKTTAEEFEKLPKEIIFNNDFSGCVLAWKFFYAKVPIPLFLLYLQDRDLWKTTQPDSNIINEGLYNLISIEYNDDKPDFSKWHEYMQNSKWFNNTKQLGTVLLQQKTRTLNSAKKFAKLVNFKCNDTNYKIMLCNSTSYISELGDIFVNENKCDFSILYRIVGEEIWISLRSKGTFDTTVISKYYGGGGHLNASGFTTTFDKFKLSKDSLIINL